MLWSLLGGHGLVYEGTITRQVASRRRATRTSGRGAAGAAGRAMRRGVGGAGPGAAGGGGGGGGVGGARPRTGVGAAGEVSGATVGLQEHASGVVHASLQRQHLLQVTLTAGGNRTKKNQQGTH